MPHAFRAMAVAPRARLWLWLRLRLFMFWGLTLALHGTAYADLVDHSATRTDARGLREEFVPASGDQIDESWQVVSLTFNGSKHDVGVNMLASLGICFYADNNAPDTTYFVPLNSAEELLSFHDNKPNGIYIDFCRPRLAYTIDLATGASSGAPTTPAPLGPGNLFSSAADIQGDTPTLTLDEALARMDTRNGASGAYSAAATKTVNMLHKECRDNRDHGGALRNPAQVCNQYSWSESIPVTADFTPAARPIMANPGAWSVTVGPRTGGQPAGMTAPPMRSCPPEAHGQISWETATTNNSRRANAGECPGGPGDRTLWWDTQNQYVCFDGTEEFTGAVQNVNEHWTGSCAPAGPPALHGFAIGLNGGYEWTEGPKAGMGSCTLQSDFNTFVIWSPEQGNPADTYTLVASRAGQTITKTFTSADVFCASGGCEASGLYSVAQAEAFVPEVDWSKIVYDHTVTNGSGGVEIYPWITDGTVTLTGCNASGCSSTTLGSADFRIFSQGQRDCQAANGGAAPWPATAPP